MPPIGTVSVTHWRATFIAIIKCVKNFTHYRSPARIPTRSLIFVMIFHILHNRLISRTDIHHAYFAPHRHNSTNDSRNIHDPRYMHFDPGFVNRHPANRCLMHRPNFPMCFRRHIVPFYHTNIRSFPRPSMLLCHAHAKSV